MPRTPPDSPTRSPAPADAVSPWVRLRSASYHPFIYKRMVGAVDPQARPGDIVAIYDKQDRLFGRGLYNPRSQIALRVLTHGDAPVDDAFWRARLQDALELRRLLRVDEVTDAYRLVHAEGDGLSGLIVERYADCLVFELFALGMQQRAPQLAEMLKELLGSPRSLDRPDRAERWHVVLRADPQIEALEGFSLARRAPARAAELERAVPGTLVVREHGMRYRVDLAGGQKTGFFCDQRENRLRFARLCRDARVLDVCCYSGGFGLCAKLLGAADEVTAVDLDEGAIDLARQNVNLNQTRVELVHADAFGYLRQIQANQRTFDAVVLDPPKLALSRDDYDDALRKYHDLNALVMAAVRPGGLLLTCSCSGLVSRDVFVETIHRAARRAGRTLQLFDFTGAGPDHPVRPSCPESAYLKAAWARIG